MIINIMPPKFSSKSASPLPPHCQLLSTVLLFITLIFHISNAQAQQKISGTTDENLSTKVLSTLSTQLNKKDCWLLSKYFAHKTLDPVKSEVEVAKYGGGGYYSNFNCRTTLKYWEKKFSEKELAVVLPNGLRFIRQKQLLESGQRKQIVENAPPNFVNNENKNQQIGQNLADFDTKLDLDAPEDRVAKYDAEYFKEILTEKTENEETEKVGIYTLLVFILIGIIATCILVATCLAYFRSRHEDDLDDDNASEETIPDFVASGLSGASGEGKIIGSGSSDSVKDSVKASRTSGTDVNRNNHNNLVIDVENVHAHDHINQNYYKK